MDPYNTADALDPRPQPAAAAPIVAPANPYAAPSARLAELRGEELNRASRLSRLGAQILDGLIVGVPIGIAVALAIPGMRLDKGVSTGATTLLVVLGLAAVAFAIYQLVLLYRSGQTLGKKLVGIRIVRTDGSRVSLLRIIFLRYLAIGLLGGIPIAGPFISLANYLLIFGSEKRCIHDYFADTIVVDA